MAVYTHLTAAEIAQFVAHYDVGELVSAKGIAEGVSNSNWLIETARGRFILTVYEERTEVRDLPFFLDLLDHLAARDCPVPRTIHDREGASYRLARGKPAALIEFLPGVSEDEPSPEQAHATGAALARMHLAARDFGAQRDNTMGPQAWHTLLGNCGAEGLGGIAAELPDLVETELAHIDAHWPTGLPQSVIHADLFPDNVLLRGNSVSAMIDFYFACTGMMAFDLAVTHAAWSFADGGRRFRPDVGAALIAGYETRRTLDPKERAALPTLARGAAMRFVATRAWDWLNTPADALVTRKDPMDFARRALFYRDRGAEVFQP